MSYISPYEVDVEAVFKYGYGLLQLSESELKEMDLSEFVDRVSGGLMWEEQRQERLQDRFLDWLSFFTANIMLSSGNLKKGTDAIKLKEGLYKTREEFEREQKESKAKSVAEQREELIKRFELNN